MSGIYFGALAAIISILLPLEFQIKNVEYWNHQ